jgi:hypothetical protein
MSTETDILSELETIELTKSFARAKIHEHKSEVYRYESHLIEAKLREDELREDLATIRDNDPVANADLRDSDIQGFRDRHPEWCVKK